MEIRYKNCATKYDKKYCFLIIFYDEVHIILKLKNLEIGGFFLIIDEIILYHACTEVLEIFENLSKC